VLTQLAPECVPGDPAQKMGIGPKLPQCDCGVHRAACGQGEPSGAERVITADVGLDQIDQGLSADHEASHGHNLVAVAPPGQPS